MPVMDGLDLAERIHESGLDIMIIILTGYREFEYAQRAIRYGAIEFLLKPFSLDEACQVLQRHMNDIAENSPTFGSGNNTARWTVPRDCERN